MITRSVAKICLLALNVALLHIIYGSWSHEMDLELFTELSKRLFICFWKLWILNCKTHWKMKLQSNQTLTGVFFLQARNWTSDPFFLPWLSWHCFVHGEIACRNTALFPLVLVWELLHFLPFCIFLESLSQKA